MDASSDTTQHYIRTLTDIKMELSEKFPLLSDFPILEIDPEEKKLNNYLGVTYFSIQNGRCLPAEVRIRFLDPGYSPYEFIRVLPTLLHEFAHILREKDREVDTLRNKQLKRLAGDHSSHDQEFYKCFQTILEFCAEKNIYFLPSGNIPSLRSIKEFDAFDLSECTISACGTSHRFTKIGEKIEESTSSAILSSSPVRIIVSHKNQQKPITLTQKTIDELLTMATQKLRIKPKATKAFLPSGIPVSEEILFNIKPDTKISVS